jgi:hypothetical protein
LCDPELCHDSPGHGERCESCPLTKLDHAMTHTSAGLLLQRSLRKLSALKMGIAVTLDDVYADEMYALALIKDERDQFDKESSAE